MPRRSLNYQKVPWTGGMNTSVDPGVLNDNDLVQAENVILGTTGVRAKREGISFIGTAIPTPDFRSSAGLTKTLKFTTNEILQLLPSVDELLVVGERITVTTTSVGDEATYTAEDTPILTVSQVAEVTDVTTVADVAGSLNSTHFFLSAGPDKPDYYVWYDVSSGGTDPAIANRTGIEVDISTNDTANAVASATQAAIDLVVDFSASVLTATVTVTNAQGGVNTDAVDVDTGFTITVTTQGGDEITYIGDASLTESSTAIVNMTIARASSVINLLDYWRVDVSVVKQQLLLSATDDFQLFKYDSNDNREEIEADKETTTILCLAASTLASTGNADHFLIDAANSTTSYYVWYDVDNGNIDPAVSGRTGIEVDVAAADADTVVATKTQVAIDAIGDFDATVLTATVTVVNNLSGVAIDAADVNTGFTVTVTLQGATNPTSPIETIDSLTMNNRAIFALEGRGNLPIKYRTEDSDNYQLLGGLPPDFSIMEEFLARVWTNDKDDPDRVHYSSTGNPEEWNGNGDSGAIDISPGDGDSQGITSIYQLKGILFVAKGSKLFRIDGNSPETFRITPVSSGIGVQSHNSAVPIDQDDVLFVSKRGFHSTVTTAAFGDTETQFISAKIQPTFNELKQSRLKFIQAAYIPELNSAAFALSENQSTNNSVFFYHTLLREWYTWPNISCQALSTRIFNNETKLILGTDDGRVQQAQNGTFSDPGTTAICYRVKTGAVYPGGDPQKWKAFKALGFLYKPLGSFTFTVQVKIDNQPEQALTYTQTTGGDLLGTTFRLGSSILGSENVLAPFMQSIDGYGRGITITITQTGTDEQVQLYGFILEFEDADTMREVV